MKVLHPKMTATQWHAALAESDELWPEPSLAPDVPPEATFEEYLAIGPKDFKPPWLREQIEQSPACQRALEDLRLRRRLPQKNAATEALLKAGLRIGDAASSRPMPACREETEPLRLGELRRTSGMVFMFADDRLKRRQTFRPVLVAVVEGPLIEGDQQFWRAVVCTPAKGWPEEYFSDDEILVRSNAGVDYVAHLWLEYPVASVQFGTKVSDLSAPAIENLLFAKQALDNGLPLGPETSDHGENAGAEAAPLVSGFRLDPKTDAVALTERRRLHECASWLSATLDAQIDYEAWQSSLWKASELRPKNAEDVWGRLTHAAARDRTANTILVTWDGALAEFQAAITTNEPRPGFQESSAECILKPIAADDGETCFAQWSIPPDHALLAGRRFAVFDPEAARLIGSGTVTSQGEGLPLLAELESGLWKDFQRKKVENLILLIPTQW